MPLLSSKAIIGFDQFYRLATDRQEQIMSAKREVSADLLNAASVAIENHLQSPVITQQFTEYYWGQAGVPDSLSYEWGPEHHFWPTATSTDIARYLWLEKRPVVIDVGTKDLLVRVRRTGDSLEQSDGTWDTWTQDTDFVVNHEKGLLTVNPAVRTVWPLGFRNVYVDYWAGYGDQVLDTDDEVVDSAVPADIKLACAKLAEHWFQSSVVQYGAAFIEQSNFRPDGSSMPMSVKMLLEPYMEKRPLTWAMA